MKPFVVALPSKGRIQEGAFAFLAEAGLPVRRDAEARDYLGALDGLAGAEVQLLSAAEVARALEAGRVHVGITGEDLLRDEAASFEERIAILKPLGFSRADVVVAVPQSWIDVRSMADLDDVCLAFRARNHRHLRVATKYVALTRAFFSAHGISDYRIVESVGATEGAPAAGTAEIVVDITSTGTTLAANRLKVLEDGLILRSEANLAASLAAPWTEEAFAALRELLDRMAAHADAARLYEVDAVLPEGISGALAAEIGALGAELAGEAGAVTLLCPAASLPALSRALRAAGAGTVRARRPDYVFRADNPIFDAFRARLDAHGR
ncbi:MAG: ATP phosphoribosyltransferase [Alphaproteobacteria bacterium]|nr:ATP phosphoribosyltransferase [Alphaproteobacteria bacterium]